MYKRLSCAIENVDYVNIENENAKNKKKKVNELYKERSVDNRTKCSKNDETKRKREREHSRPFVRVCARVFIFGTAGFPSSLTQTLHMSTSLSDFSARS